jgi:hypothetical protein
MLEQTKQSIDKKKSKLKEFEENLTGKLEAKKTEINELKASHAKDIEQLTKNFEEMKEKVSFLPLSIFIVIILIKPNPLSPQFLHTALTGKK